MLTTQVTKRYRWFQIAKGGGLEDPDPVDIPGWFCKSLNNADGSGFHSEQDAEEYFRKLFSDEMEGSASGGRRRRHVLLPVYEAEG